jgi:hypothetical protein
MFSSSFRAAIRAGTVARFVLRAVAVLLIEAIGALSLIVVLLRFMMNVRRLSVLLIINFIMLLFMWGLGGFGLLLGLGLLVAVSLGL